MLTRREDPAERPKLGTTHTPVGATRFGVQAMTDNGPTLGRSAAHLGPGGPVIGLDIGATKWIVGLFEDEAELAMSQSGHISDDPHRDLTDIEIAIRQLHSDQRVAALGCAFAGSMRDGKVAAWPNRPTWHGFRLVQHLTRIVPRVRIEDDGLCAALAEARCGVARGLHDFVCLSFGTGVGAGLVIGESAQHLAQSLGHFRVGSDVPCPCGNTGCLQATFRDWLDHREVALGGPHGIVSQPLQRIAETIADFAHVLALEAVILTGGLLEHDPSVAAELQLAMEPRLALPALKLFVSRRPSLSAVVGAALLVEELPGSE